MRGAIMLRFANETCVLIASGYVGQVLSRVTQYLSGLDRQAWLLVLCGGLVVGLFCLRGFGSRSSY